MRMFYVPMVFSADSYHQPDASCFFAYPKGPGLKFPHFVTLSSVPASASGIYNHWEFFLKLLSVDSRPEVWEISQCSYTQSSPKSFCLTGVSERHGRPGQPSQRASAQPSSSSGPAEDLDVSFFDAPLLLQPGSLQRPMFLNQDGPGHLDGDYGNEGDDGESNGNPYEEEEGFISDGLLSDEDRQVQDTVPRDQDGAMDADNKSDSAKSGESAMSGIKTVATDTQILKDCLGSRPV